MSEVQEKDNFWVYVGLLVGSLIVVLLMVRGGEHDKYVAAEKAIAEDASNSAYRNSKL